MGAAKWGISREKQDALAISSHQKALKAMKDGLYKEEIVPLKATMKDKKTGATKEVICDKDEGPRMGIKPADLAKLGPAFQKGGSTTAGNASQTTDGAAMVLMASRKRANELGLPIIGKLVSFAVAGCEPEVMGIGPAVAIPKALEKAGLTVEDIDIFEINEAFASQACTLRLGLPKARGTDPQQPSYVFLDGSISYGGTKGAQGIVTQSL